MYGGPNMFKRLNSKEKKAVSSDGDGQQSNLTSFEENLVPIPNSTQEIPPVVPEISVTSSVPISEKDTNSKCCSIM